VLTSAVSQLIVAVADRVVMPRFRRLAPGEVAEKSPGDLVSIADAQARLAQQPQATQAA
jgi:fructose-1,6-bisphosphatase/inositol monophosphatase family enzyme